MLIVSNSLPFVVVRDNEGNLKRKPLAGGFVAAVTPAIAEQITMWIGWPGMYFDNVDEVIPEPSPESTGPTAELPSERIVPVNVSPEEFDNYYNGCCNSTFWPLFHSMPYRAIFNPRHWEAYSAVNRIFADKTIQSVKKMLEKKSEKQPLVWIHDYHLMIAANRIRRAMEDDSSINCRLGFFLYTPFPTYDTFRICPWKDEVLQGILGHDMVGFYIESYAQNFIQCCQERLGCRVDRERMFIEHGGRTVHVRTLPIGIPYDRFVSMANQSKPFVRQNPDQKLILGVDRLDYTKGLLNRMRAIEKLLEIYPEHRSKISFVQVAVPPGTDVKEYQVLKEELDQETGRINGRFSSLDWSPIRYIYRFLPREDLASYYKAADVALVTPLRDGMNLVAKEFVACQTGEPGVLILSPFTGAGEVMLESLSVNPYETTDVAHVINRALNMPLDERQFRMNLLRKRERKNDIHHWLDSFMKEIDSVTKKGNEENDCSSSINMEDFDLWMSRYILDSSNKLALLLDYDGTLAPIAPHPNVALMPAEVKRVLERLSNLSDVHIAIISGRKVEYVKAMVGIDKITYAGSHGIEILHPDGARFTHPESSQYLSKMADLRNRLREELEIYGAWVENEEFLLIYHVGNVARSRRDELLRRAVAMIKEYGFTPCKAHCAVEAKPPPVVWNEGRACIHILRTTFGMDWNERIRIIYAGDDVTNDDALTQLKGLAFTFRVTSSQPLLRTASCKRLTGTDSLLMMLKYVEKLMASNRPPRSPSPRTTTTSPPEDESTVFES